MNNILVGLLTEIQKEQIQGKEFAKDSFFYVIKDANNNWVISIQEMEQATIPPYEWVHELPLIEYNPKPL